MVDPKQESPFKAWQRLMGEKGVVVPKGDPGLPGQPPYPPTPLIFECVGVPGLIANLINDAPRKSDVVIIGVCMMEDKFRPTKAIGKEVSLNFVQTYTHQDFGEALDLIAKGFGKQMITGEISFNEISKAFEVLGKAEQHAKIMVKPFLPAGGGSQL